ncbi:hypothetical protein SteCoe_14037 [Stentor coeruleus]|uniref:Uncharacterized protein n=1 Tax=Stentor coeruleus TaxID=5963 RepID=A0A1R2C6Z0_9CILI|nr:hypothetical protein SteCoe_14037 [Stentor coeruleus]
MSLRITEKTNSKPPSLYNDTFLHDFHLRSETKEYYDLLNELDIDSFSDNSMRNISQRLKVKNSNQEVLDALKGLKNSIDILSDRVDKQNLYVSKIITTEEVQKRIEEKYKSVKEMKRKRANSKCYIF